MLAWSDPMPRVCQAPNRVLPSRVNQYVAILCPDREQLSPEYLKYYLLNPKFKTFMLGMASVGGTRNVLTYVDLLAIRHTRELR